jgi:hypothetical protein
MFVAKRISIDDVSSELDELRAAAVRMRRAWRKAELTRAGIAAAVAGGLFLVGVIANTAMVALPLVCAAIAAIYWAFPDRHPLGHPRVLAKILFLENILGLLSDELLPRSRIGLRFDMNMYDFAGKLARTARSGGGRAKKYYSDRWLQLAFTLADGTRVRLLRHAGVKEKSGSVVRETRRLSLSIRPNAHLYAPTHADAELKRALQQGVLRAFSNMPEGYNVKVHRREQHFDVKILQDDTDISPEEVMALLWSAIDYLGRRRLKRA